MPRKVLASFESPDRTHCVDVFKCDDGSFGFEEFRRDTDGGNTWQPLGRYSSRIFGDGSAALAAAQSLVHWLDKDEIWRW